MMKFLCILQLSAVFWNVENFFDPYGDEGDFTPTGSYHWTWSKFTSKRNDLAKTLIALGTTDSLGGWTPPALIGLAEVENRYVLRQMLTKTSLSLIPYDIVHRDSPDRRGIDVALLYDRTQFTLLSTHYLSLDFPTREILYAKGLAQGDTLHVFVNHWPSKRGGAAASAPNREQAARVLWGCVDSLFRHVEEPLHILVMGDFNDPVSPPDGMVNISDQPTYKYQGRWECLDQFLVNASFLEAVAHVEAIEFPFLLERDKTHLGMKPRRTYIGPRYNAGVSDHLPIRVNFLNFVDYAR